jgi:hypothetical protein
MSNTILSAATISEAAVILLANQAQLVNTVLKVNSDSYAGSGGQTSLRVSRPIQATTFTGSTTASDVTEHAVSVTPVHKYNRVDVSAAESTMNIVDFATEILNPMIAGIVEVAEQAVASQLHAVTETGDFDTTDEESIRASVLAMRKILVQNKVPAAQRFLACSPSVVESLLSVPTFVDASKAGQSDTLTGGALGTIFGLQVLESVDLDDEAVAYGSSAFAFASLTSPDAQGGARSVSASQGGIAIRATYDYDVSALSDVVVLDGWYGAAPVLDLVDSTPTQLRAVRYVIGS